MSLSSRVPRRMISRMSAVGVASSGPPPTPRLMPPRTCAAASASETTFPLMPRSYLGGGLSREDVGGVVVDQQPVARLTLEDIGRQHRGEIGRASCRERV